MLIYMMLKISADKSFFKVIQIYSKLIEMLCNIENA